MMNPEKFKEHVIFEKLEQYKHLLNTEDVTNKIDIDNIHFYNSALDYISKRLKIVIPTLINEPELTALYNELNASLTQINNFLGNNNIGHLNNAKNNFTTALNRIRNFPFLFAKSKFNYSKEIAGFEATLTKKYKLLDQANKEVDKKINEHKSILDSKQQEIDKVNQLLVQKQNEINSLTTNFTNELNSIKNTADQQFQQERTKFRQEFDTEKQNFQKEKETLHEEYENKINNSTKEMSVKTTQVMKDLKTKLEESKKLVNVIGNIGATGNYQKIADYHKKQANTWRWIALSFMILLTGLLIFTIYHITGGDFNWKVAIVRIVAFSTLLYPATYASKESSKHRTLENINRKSELDIASISPFIEILPDEKKQEIKEKMVEKFFGNNNGFDIDDRAINKDKISIGSFEKLLKALIPFFHK